MRTIGVVTVARSDYGIYLPVLRAIEAEPDLRLHLLVGGMHLSPEFGLSVQAIEADGFPIAERVEMLLSSDTPEGIAKSIGMGVLGFAQALGRSRPDLLLVLGDRFEMLAAVSAALPFDLPIAHIHGGETTEGAIDESIRHALTKMSHLHFVATEPYRDRVIQMGEEPWRVHVSGAPGLDNLRALDLLSPGELEAVIGMALAVPPLLVTYHPVTREHGDAQTQIAELLAALQTTTRPIIFTYPNADAEGRIIIEAIDRFVQTHPRAKAVVNLGTRAYLSLMRQAAAMVGNSSSGIIEAASFALPVVNIGSRQRGRLRAGNVLDCGYERQQIAAAIEKAVSAPFRESLADLTNPYGDGQAAERIVSVLRSVELDRRLTTKRFHDLVPAVPAP